MKDISIYNPFSCNHIEEDSGKSPLELAGVNTAGINLAYIFPEKPTLTRYAIKAAALVFENFRSILCNTQWFLIAPHPKKFWA